MNIPILKNDDPNLTLQSVEQLEKGGLIIYPTDTVYAIGCDATNQDAVNRLSLFKDKIVGQPLPIAVSDISMAEKYVELNSMALNLYKNFLPGRLTIISKNKGLVADGLSSELNTIGVRIIENQMVDNILSEFGKPIVTTSASNSDRKFYSIDDFLDHTGSKKLEMVDLIIDCGKLKYNDVSTVVDTTLNQELIVRQGTLRLSNSERYISKNLDETIGLGKKFIQKYEKYLRNKALIFALQGDLGAGKTQLTKGIAFGLGIKDIVVSPTFIIENEFLFGDNKKLYHFDTWRLYNSSELIELGIKDKINKGNVIVLEWADRVVELIEQFKNDVVVIWIKLDYGLDENTRNITVSDKIY